MTSTQQLMQFTKSILVSLDAVVKKDVKIDSDYTAVNAKISKRYHEKISQLENIRTQRISSAVSQDRNIQQKLQAALDKLVNIESEIPAEYKNKYRKTTAAAYVPKKPDFQTLSEIAARINDVTFSGHLKRIFHYDGYAFMYKMVNEFLDAIESARAFLSEEEKKSFVNLTRIKSLAEQEFRATKTEVDKKKSNYMSQNEQQLKYAAAALQSEFTKVIESPDLKRLDERILSTLSLLGAFEDDWNTYIPADSYPKEIMLGAIELPLNLPLTVCDMVKDKMPTACFSGKGITLPLSSSIGEPLQLLISYDNQQKGRAMAGIQSIILKLIRFMPSFSWCLTYIDPNDRGTNLGLLQKLATITSADICKKVYTSKEDITKRLKELEVFVDQTSAELAGVDNIYTYNATNETKIQQHFVVVNDYPTSFERNAIESLGILINNSKKCGISFIFTTSGIANNQLPSSILINARNNGTTITMDAHVYDFMFDSVITTCDSFLEKVKTVQSDGIKVDNHFSVFFKLYDTPQYKESTHTMYIPFAVGSRKHLIELELGGAQSAHALLSGRTGSGKSTTLHMFITSIVLHYHPDDVALWLVDYKKVEFAEYIRNRPPHVRFIGLERSAEFTFSLLDKIEEEFQRRLEIFKSLGVNNITEYKEKFGVRSLPRIVFIVDEFHQMTQAIRNEPRYVQILENILSEYRVFGLSCVFSDQAISDGLRGLTEKGRKQISIRIAMENDMSEIKETLSLDNSFYDDSLKSKIMTMSKGDVVFKRFSNNGEIVLDKYKTILASREERNDVSAHSQKFAGSNMKPKDVLVIDGLKRSELEISQIREHERKVNVDFSRHIPIYVGTPANLDLCFYFYLRNVTGSNIMLIGADDDLRASVLLHAIYSFKRISNTKVFVFAYETDELFVQYKEQIKTLLGQDDKFVTDLLGTCMAVDEITRLIKAKNESRILMCWLGLEEFAVEFSFQKEKQSSLKDKSVAAHSTNAVDSLINEMDALLDAFDNVPKSFEPKQTISDDLYTSFLYDARPDLNELFYKGPRYGLFSLVTYSSVKMIRQTKFIKTENFEHKIGFNMTMDDSSTYIGKGSYASGLDAISAVYDDGSGKIRTFRPYLISKERIGV